MKFNIGFNFSYFENIYQNISSCIIYFSCHYVLFVKFILLECTRISLLNMQASYKKIIFSFLLGVLIYVLSNNKNNGYLDI